MRSARERLNKHVNLDNLKLIDDIAKMATGALGSFSEVRHQVKAMVRQRVDQIITEMDMVTRAEFDRVEAIATRARARQEELEQRLAKLEGKRGTAAKPKKTAKATKRNKK